jgi:hypothetical protein
MKIRTSDESEIATYKCIFFREKERKEKWFSFILHNSIWIFTFFLVRLFNRNENHLANLI